MDITVLTDVMKSSLNDFLTSSSHNAQQYAAEIQDFMTRVSPEIESAIAAGDERSLSYLRDRLLGEAARASLALIADESQAVVAILMAVVKTAVKIAL